jgi:hypothetical protein
MAHQQSGPRQCQENRELDHVLERTEKAMADQITQLIDTMQQLERLLVRFELDMAARLHAVDYQAIETLCDSFHAQMTELKGSSGEQVGKNTTTVRSVSDTRGVTRIRHE